MSIQAQITRLENNVNNALSAIADKGVTVPSNAKSDDLSTLIGSISTSENLDTELTEQESLISQLSTILDSKASGGGSATLETCTVTINDGGNLNSVIYESVSNGEKVGATSRIHEDPNYMWDNRVIAVVKGSLLIACGGDSIVWSTTGDAALESSIVGDDYVGSGYTYLFRINGNCVIEAVG